LINDGHGGVESRMNELRYLPREMSNDLLHTEVQEILTGTTAVLVQDKVDEENSGYSNLGITTVPDDIMIQRVKNTAW